MLMLTWMSRETRDGFGTTGIRMIRSLNGEKAHFNSQMIILTIVYLHYFLSLSTAADMEVCKYLI